MSPGEDAPSPTRTGGTRLAGLVGRIGVLERIGLGFVARAWSQVTALALGLVAARILGKAEFGTYTIASAFVVLLQALMYGGIYDYLIRERQAGEGAHDTCFWMNLAFGMASSLLLAVCSLAVGAFVSRPAAALLMGFAPTTVLAALASWQEAILLGRGRVRSYYGVWLAVETLSSAVALLCLLRGFGFYAFVVYRYLLLALSCLAYAAAVRRRPRLSWSGDVARQVWSFSLNIYLSRIVGIGANYGGDILIGALASPAAAGSYRLASRIVFGLSELTYQPAATLAWVQFAEARAEGRTMLAEWRRLVTVLTFTAWAALAVLAFNASAVLALVVGPGWSDAAPIVQILAAARMLALAEVFLDPVLGVLGRTAAILRIRAAAAVLALVSIVVLARFGAAGAAASQVVLEVALAAVTFRVFVGAGVLAWRDLAATMAPGLCCLATVLAGQAAAHGLRSAVAPPAAGTMAIALGAALVSWLAFLAAWLAAGGAAGRGLASRRFLRQLPI